jgi:phosphatidylinositol-4,5-bisphosphate 3-kinase
MTDNEIASCLPQLVQALKYDVYDMSELGVFLIERAIVQPALIGIPFFWCCKVEFRSAHCRGRYAKYIHEYKLRCGKQQLTLLDRQDRLWSETGVFQKVAAAVYAQKGKSKSKILETLHMQLEGIIKNHELPEIFELPLDPRIRVKMPIVKKCRVMSSAKLPLWLTFENAEPGYEKVMVMFKAGDDLRQDTMVLQLMRVMDSMWRSQNKQLFMSPYKCMATWHDGGLLEIVKNSQTTADIHMQYGGGFTGAFQKDTFIKFIQDHNGKDGEKFDRAVHMFIKSCAAYCVATYIMGIGDRHNDNIMIKKNGQYFHIDFGHFLGNFKYQFGIKRERTPFVFTPEMAEVMGGKGDVKFDDFVAECGSAYNILRENGSTLINLFLLMVPAGMPELASSEDINYLRDQLAFGKGIEDAKDAFKQEIYNALKDRFKQFDNMIHIAKHKF